DLPVEQPTQFLFAVNLEAARRIGLTVPDSVLAQATEVIRRTGAASCAVRRCWAPQPRDSARSVPATCDLRTAARVRSRSLALASSLAEPSKATTTTPFTRVCGAWAGSSVRT